jgi:toxin secretion/phage lysis holin
MDDNHMLSNFSPAVAHTAFLSALAELWAAKASVSAVIAAISTFLGADQVLIYLLLLSMVLDFLFGVWDAHRRRRFRCRAMQRGAGKIGWYFVYVGLVAIVDVAVAHATSFHFPCLDLFLAYLVLTETVSVTAHLQSMGVRVPPLLLSFVQRARKSVEKKFDNPESTTEEPLFEDKCQKIGQNRIK